MLRKTQHLALVPGNCAKKLNRVTSAWWHCRKL